MRFLVSIAMCVLCSSAFAAGPKAGQIEYSAALVHSFSDTAEGLSGSKLDLSSRTGFQIGFDYFVSDKLSVGFDATWVRPKFEALLVPEDGSAPITINNRSDIFTGQLNGTYNFLQGSFTPYVEGGLGWTYFDSNVSDGSPVVGCWWDPLWGYICSDFYTSYSATNFSYGVGAGLRWDVNRDIAVKAGYRWLEVEADSLRNKPRLESLLLEVVYKF